MVTLFGIVTSLIPLPAKQKSPISSSKIPAQNTACLSSLQSSKLFAPSYFTDAGIVILFMWVPRKAPLHGECISPPSSVSSPSFKTVDLRHSLSSNANARVFLTVLGKITVRTVSAPFTTVEIFRSNSEFETKRRVFDRLDFLPIL